MNNNVTSGSCPVNGTWTKGAWNSVELRFNNVTGLLQSVVGGVVTDCQATQIPPNDTRIEARVGIESVGTSNAAHTIRYDNVIVSLKR